MKAKLKKQLQAYAGIAGVILASEESEAQVFFHDFVPDLYVGALSCSSSFYYLDMNQDAISDFKLIAASCVPSTPTSTGSILCTHGTLSIRPQNNNNMVRQQQNCWFGCNNGNLPVPENMNTGVINNIINFSYPYDFLYIQRNGCYQSVCTSTCGKWSPGTISCVGVKIVKNNLSYFGWIKIHILSRSECEIMEYAYEQSPNCPINACSTVHLPCNVGIEENTLDCNYSQENNLFSITCYQNVGPGVITFYDLLGKEILNRKFDGKQATIPIDKKGIYFVELKTEKNLLKKKVFVY